jgi:hypothetical protein
MKVAWLSALALACGLAVSGCGGDDEAESTGHAYSVQASLAELPASVGGDQPLVLTGDLNRASEVAGLARPADADGDDARRWLSSLSGAVSATDPSPQAFVPFPDQLIPTTVDPADALGWSVLDVDDFVAVDQPPVHFLVVSGAFDADTLDPDLAEVDDGIVTDVEGADHEFDVQHPTALSPLGAPTRLAERDGRIAASSSTDAVREWLDDHDTLADDEGFAAVARALDDQDAYSAVLSPAPHGIDPTVFLGGIDSTPESVHKKVAKLEAELLDDPYDDVGIGWSADDDGALVSVAYHFGSEDQAEDSVDALRDLYESGVSVQTQRPYSEDLEVEDVTTSGAVAVVRARPAPDASVDAILQMLTAREPLFSSR